MNGMKTYTVAIATILIAIAGLVLFFVDPGSELAIAPLRGIELILAGAALFGVRSALKKQERGDG